MLVSEASVHAPSSFSSSILIDISQVLVYNVHCHLLCHIQNSPQLVFISSDWWRSTCRLIVRCSRVFHADRSGVLSHQTGESGQSPRSLPKRSYLQLTYLTYYWYTLSASHRPTLCYPLEIPLPHSLPLLLEYARRAMTSTSTRRSFSGKPLQTQARSRTSSGTTSPPIETPSDSSPPPSPPVEMSLRVKSPGTVNGIGENLERTQINGTKKGKRDLAHDRKQSTPMMPAFMVSAPGKVIVFGEHAVVHGKVSREYTFSL